MDGKIPKQRDIYSNYDLWEKYPDEEIKSILIEEEKYETEDEIPDEAIWEERDFLDETDWEIKKEILEDLFSKGKFMFFGDVGRWNGIYKAGLMFDTLDELLSTAASDCDYIHFYDENGHLYLTCSHHDGTCHYEIKEVTDKGIQYLENWKYNWNDKRSAKYVHTQIFNHYSRLPNFAHKYYGCKLREYEPVTKGRLIDEINNSAKSFYC